jgi:hypothetical protein
LPLNRDFDRASRGSGVEGNPFLRVVPDERGDELLAVPDAELMMPAPLDALATAVGYLRDAVPLLAGHARGAALKALAQALIALDRHGVRVDRSEIRAMADEARRLLDPSITPQDRRNSSRRSWQAKALVAPEPGGTGSKTTPTGSKGLTAAA